MFWFAEVVTTLKINIRIDISLKSIKRRCILCRPVHNLRTHWRIHKIINLRWSLGKSPQETRFLLSPVPTLCPSPVTAWINPFGTALSSQSCSEDFDGYFCVIWWFLLPAKINCTHDSCSLRKISAFVIALLCSDACLTNAASLSSLSQHLFVIKPSADDVEYSQESLWHESVLLNGPWALRDRKTWKITL